ncbi:hypothetical protein RFI_08840 [Reticulomyxa filosa]|uniref:RRM domain-containing protein n=1 Tax=Reticulomyxa filosa TaxID=46433 RepID=X6NRE2_RETFI|nr:hypothetical protein RFI_08840 [Reticulomyxa filosa]|eukprot:ETO28294.1 hypothetical protein RFI_08840 [Reticulomyxa filosa]
MFDKVLSTAIGYRELLIALLAHHKKPIDIGELEHEFEELFNMHLNACSPVINRVLKKINDPTLNQEQKQSQLHHTSQAVDESNSSRSSLHSSLRSSYSSLKSMITKFRLATNFELHYEKNRALFELVCPKCRQDASVIKSPFKEDHRTVFMGGFAHGTSTKELEDALAEYGAKMIDCKGISFRNYGWSFVTVETPQQAEDLIARSPIQIRGRNIDVRPFIDRKRVVSFVERKEEVNQLQDFKNHQQNRPSPKKLLIAVLDAVQQNPSGLTVAQMQTNLFHKFQFRVDGPEITKLVSRNAKLLQIKRHPIEKIKMHRLKMDELKWKILKIWNSSDSTQDGTDENNVVSEGEEKVKEQKVLSLADFENEFARPRYTPYCNQ